MLRESKRQFIFHHYSTGSCVTMRVSRTHDSHDWEVEEERERERERERKDNNHSNMSIIQIFHVHHQRNTSENMGDNTAMWQP
jgi:hypothetical protein